MKNRIVGDDVRRLINSRRTGKLESPYVVSYNVLALAMLIFALSATAATNEVTGIMQKALFEEEGNHNLSAAIEGYQSIITRFDESRALTATAVFRLGECYRKQNKTNEAASQYQRIVRDFGDQTTLVSLSQQNLSALTGQTLPRTQASGASLSPAPEGSQQTIPSPTLEEEEIRRIRTMVKDSPDLINARAAFGETPLQKAIKQSQVTVIQFLLNNGADIEAKDNEGHTALHIAAGRGNRVVVESLLDRKADVRVMDRENETPLHFAAQNGFRAIAELLIDHGADINAKNVSGATPLHLAVANGYRAVAELLISRKANLNVAGDVQTPGFNNNLKGTPLHIAVRRADESMVKLLLASKASVDAPNAVGETPLDNAAADGNANMVKLLLDNGANPNSKNSHSEPWPWENWTPLHYAAANLKRDAAALLLSSKADPNARVPMWLYGTEQKKDYTPLLMTAASGDGDAVEVLLANGADPNLTGLNGDTPLMNLMHSRHASEPEQLRAIKALLDHGADPNAGWPMRTAVFNMQKDVVKLLIEHKADLNTKSTEPHNQGNTILNLIVQQGANPDLLVIAEMLLAAGADVNLPNAYGKTPLSYIRSPDDYWVQMAGLLRKYGGVTDVPDFRSIRFQRKGSDPIIVLRQDTNAFNHFTLFEAIANYFSESWGQPTFVPNAPAPLRIPTMMVPQGGSLPFPDLSRLKIMRPRKGSVSDKQLLPASALNATNAFDGSKDTPLEFGDVIDVPEREHNLTERPQGLTDQQWDSLRGCLLQRITFRTRAGTVELEIPSIGHGDYLSAATKEPRVQALLTSASDLKRVKVQRVDRRSKKVSEIIEDVESFWDQKQPAQDDLWLRDGDVVEVPDK